MKSNKLKTFYVFLNFVIPCTIAICCSCNEKDTDSSVQGAPLQLSANIQTIGSGDIYKLEGGESVGLWVSSNENTPLEQADIAQNIKFYQSAIGLVSEPRTYWGNHSQVHVYGYYPFDTEAADSPQSYYFAVETDQKKKGNLEASDLLWTQKTISLPDANEKAMLDFCHLMSKIIINIRGSHPEAGSLKECNARLVNVISDASVNLKDGNVTSGETRGDIDASPMTAVAANYESSLEVIVIPQTIRAGTPFLRAITKGNVENEWAPENDVILASGMQLVLDVLIEETECTVTIRDISPWEVDNEILQAEAVEQLPTYEMFDFYSRFGIQGIVVALDEGSEGQHGWIVSTDETELVWSTADVTHLKGASRTDAATNLKLALQDDPTLEKFPALKWCDDKNKARTTLENLEQNGIEGRWILLPVDVLKKKFADHFLAYGKTANLDRLNAAIENASVPNSQKVKFPSIDWNNPYVTIDYWSSTYIPGQNMARMVECATNDHSFFGGTGVFTTMSDVSATFKVRAFCHF